MSDIFISYKREEQGTARKLADALESEGWSVWWDPNIRAGEHFDEVIEKALNEAKCVIVMWSRLSVQSRYVRNEATYALDREKLVPVAIENVELPLRFRGVQTLSLVGWDGSKDFSEFRRLVDDISTILGPTPTVAAEAEGRRRVEEERLREQERRRSEEEAKRKADEEDNRRRIEEEKRRAQQEAKRRSEAEAQQRKAKEERLREKERKQPGAVFRDKLKDGSQGPEMVVVPAGTFKMGDISAHFAACMNRTSL